MKKFYSAAKYLFLLGIGIFILWLVFKGVDPDAIADGFAHANYIWVAIALSAGMLSHVSRTLRWNMLIAPLGFRPRFISAFAAIMLGYLANLALPRMGEVTRCIVLNRTDNIPVNKLFGTVIVERIIDLISLLLIVAFTFIMEFDRLKNFLSEQIGGSVQEKGDSFSTLLSPLNISIVVFVIGAGLFLLYMILRMKNPPAFIIKIRSLFEGFVSGLKTIRAMENNWLFILHTVFIWIMYFLMSYLCFFALDATDHLDLLAGLSVLAIGSLGFILPVQGGIGTFHWAVREALAIYDIDKTDGLVLGTLIHASQALMIILFGAICFLIFIYLIKKKAANEVPNLS
ncbi:MAG: lysylphosphatidylglycerol synthase transmembrane domain-containing protein [Bacteroidia bacterium]